MPQKLVQNAVLEFSDAVRLLVRRVRATGTQEWSATESSVLKRLVRDGLATTADLARAERVKPQSMGAVVATLEAAGLVTRKAHPTDGRQVNIVATAKGAAVRKSSVDAKHSWLAEAIAQLPKQDQATLFAAGKIIKRLAEG